MSGWVGADDGVFRAVADPTRRALLERLLERERSFGELAAAFGMSKPAVSQHLRVLREAELVRTRRAGRRRYYCVNPEPLRVVYEWAAKFRVLSDPQGHVWRLIE